MRSSLKVIDSGAEYLDPIGCGSLVGYELHTRRRGGVSGNITLTDCNRMITWYFSSGNSSGLEKIDRAISIFTKFRDALAKATKKRTK